MATVFRPNRLATYDDQSILAEIQRVVGEHFHGTPPAIDEFKKHSMVSGWVIRKRFGSWANAVQKAGFDYQGKNYEGIDLRRVNYTEELMIADLQRVKELNGGQYFSHATYRANGGKYSVKALKTCFKCPWSAVLKQRFSLVPVVTTKLKVHQPKLKRISEFSEESLFSELKRVWDELGRRPLYGEFKRLGRIGVKVYEKRFGNWKSAVATFYAKTGDGPIGFAGSHATSELLLAELKKLATADGSNILTFDKYRELGGSYSIGTFQNQFGSWQAAVERIGCRDGHSSKYADDQLFCEVQRLWEEYGRQPTFKDMQRDSVISPGVFQRRFGSWIKAVHAFCNDRQSPNEEEIQRECATEIQVEPSELEASVAPPVVNCAESVPTHATTILVDARRLPGKRLRFRVFQRDGFRCVICGRSPATHPGVVLHPDHIVAWSRGGLTVFENLQTTCEDCNLGKSDLIADLAPKFACQSARQGGSA